MKKQLLAITLLFTFLASYAQLTVNVSKQNALCFGSCNGTATVIPTGGTPAYSYTWMPGGQNTASVSGLCAGQYTVIVRDAAATISSATFAITEPSALVAGSTQVNAVCNCNGSLNIIASGGTAPYTYITSFGSTSAYSPFLCSGFYTYDVTDANGCAAATGSVIITQTSPINAVISSTNVTCSGLCNGAVSVVASGGVQPYTYSWAGSGNNSNSITAICAGDQYVTITDANGCTQTASVTITQPNGLYASITQINGNCNSACSQAAAASITGGTGPFSFLWSGGGGTAQVMPNVCAGNYTLTVTDSHSCIATQAVTITQPFNISASVTTTNVSCSGLCDASIHLNVTGGAGASYVISSQPPLINSINTTGLCAGIYTITVSDVNSCSFTTVQMITEPPPLSVSVTHPNTACGSCNGVINTAVGGGSLPYTYLWGSGSTMPNLANVCAGAYSVTVSDSHGCSVTATTSILNTGAALQNMTLTAIPYNETCYLTGDGAVDLNLSGSAIGPFTYNWNNGATTQDITSVTSGAYWVTVAENSGACINYSCSVNAAGTNCGTISGNVFVDSNSDCVKNTGDTDFQNAMILVNPGNRLGYTNATGDYNVNNLPYGNYSVTVSSSSPYMLPTCNTVLNTAVNNSSPNAINNDFSLEYNATNLIDAYATINSGPFSPGFNSTINYYVKKLNTNNTLGQYKVILSTTAINYILNVSPSNYILSGDTLIWPYQLLGNNSTFAFHVTVALPSTTPVGATFHTCAIVTTTIPDIDPSNNTFCYDKIITASFDPNDKTPSPVGLGAEGNITVNDKALSYLIRFQNTGTAPAVNVVVQDSVSNAVDISTFEMLSSSHNYKVDILPGNILRWKFDNIMLADSGSNEPASHGYIQYRIKQKANNPVGTQIKNTAYIYFDFNSPVITNTALNTIWEAPVGIEALSNTYGNWLVYPNPASNLLYIRNAAATESVTKLELVNAMGQVLHTESFSGANKSLDLSTYASGVYFVKLITDEQSTIKRIVISR